MEVSVEYINGPTIAGLFGAIIIAVIYLQRIGIIKVPITRNSKQNDTGNDKITSLEKIQLVQAEILERHDKQFERGNKRFDGLETDIGTINTNVGILLDRTK